MRLILGAVVGAALAVALFRIFGTHGIGAAFATLGCGGFAAVVAYHAALTALLALPWWRLLPRSARQPVGRFIWARFIRDAASQALPLSPLGGMVLGSRALVAAGVPGPLATASLIVDLGIEMAGLVGYALLGLVLLRLLRPGSVLIPPFTAALAVMALVATGFILMQSRGSGFIGRSVGHLAARLGRADPDRRLAMTHALERIHARPGNLLLAWLLHTSCWVLTAVEMWLTLALMRIPIHLGAAVVIDSLAFALRSIAFLVPSGIGIQEGAYVLLGSAFGLSPPAALALALLRRARDIAIAVPPLLIWQRHEGGRIWRRGGRAADRVERDQTTTTRMP